MPRYVTKSYIADDCAFDTKEPGQKLDVISSDEAIDTGILNANGDPVYRVRDQVGFVRREE